MNRPDAGDHPNRASAVIVNYNAGRGLVELVGSLISDAYIDRVIVVDNGSVDGSADLVAESYADEARLRLIRNSLNRGFAAANNQGAAAVQAKYLLFVNPDTVMETAMLHKLCLIMDERPEIGVLGILIRNPDGSEQRGCRRYLPDPRRSLMHALGLGGPDQAGGTAGFNLTGTPLPSGPVEIEGISGAFMLVRRQALTEVGDWDEGYFLHCEDLDLCMRLKQAGWKILFVPDESVIHMQGVSSRGRPLFVLWHKHLGMWRYFTKFHRRQNPWWLSMLVWSGIWARFLLSIPSAMLRLAMRDGESQA
jgi:GT2 family glycosyltransferase